MLSIKHDEFHALVVTSRAGKKECGQVDAYALAEEIENLVEPEAEA